MPRGSPFTLLCQLAAKLAEPGRIDLHMHTTASDGDYTPSQLTVHARNAGLAAMAITDHDTTEGLAEARATAAALQNRQIEIIPGVEISTHHAGCDYHLLGYFFDDATADLQAGLAAIRCRRRERFQCYLESFAASRIIIPNHLIEPLLKNNISLGRRHLAKLLVAAGNANTLHIAFLKYILPHRVALSHSVPLSEAIAWLHAAGGIASLAHPPAEMNVETLGELQALGLDAVETNSPSVPYGFGQDLAAWARTLHLGITAGSDYHGPDGGRVLGSRCVTAQQLDDLRNSARRSGSLLPAPSQQL